MRGRRVFVEANRDEKEACITIEQPNAPIKEWKERRLSEKTDSVFYLASFGRHLQSIEAQIKEQIQSSNNNEGLFHSLFSNLQNFLCQKNK